MPGQPQTQNEPIALHHKAAGDLARIRAVMDGASRFTGVSGWGEALIGLTAMAAAALAHTRTTTAAWLTVWLVEAGLAVAIGVGAMFLKARGSLGRLLVAPARRFGLGLVPSLAAGAALSWLLLELGHAEHLPAVWLLLYGVAVAAAGAFSVPAVPLMGVCFLAVGTAALVTPASWGDAWLAAGFGGLHLIFGLVIWRRHGG